MTDIRDTGRHEKDPARLRPVVDRYDTARAAVKAASAVRGVDETVRRDLLIAAVVALMDSVGDIPVLLHALQAARMRAANLAAAGRATLAADRDRETDPLYYLRDQLDHDEDDDPDADQVETVAR